MMLEENIKQLKLESNAWKRMLRFLTDENIYLKNKVSEILKVNFDKGLLEEIEIFHSRFLREDDLINLLRNDIAEADKILLTEPTENSKFLTEIEMKIQKIRNNISNAEIQFESLKKDFTSYISEHV